MAIELPPLPYDRTALEPHISGETIDFHYGKHHKTYVDNLNKLIEGTEFAEAPLEEIVRKSQGGMFNNAAQIWNHSFFWQCLAPANGQRPEGRLAQLIDEAFGGTDALLAKLKDEAVGHFGSGWAWLVLNGGKLEVTSLHDADTPVVYDGMKPLLTLDVWEHAYYIDYRNDRPKFVKTVLENIINWDFVAQNLDGQGVERANQEGARISAESLS